MTNKVCLQLMLIVFFISCQGKIRQDIDVEQESSNIQVEENHKQKPKSPTDPVVIDSIKEVLKKEYIQMREKENINYRYGVGGHSKMRAIVYLDSIVFHGKEEFYEKIKADITKKIKIRREYEDQAAAEENREPRYSDAYSGYDYFDAFQYIFPIIEQWLISKHFVFPSDSVYQQRMSEIFGFDGHIKNDFPLVEGQGQLHCFSVNAGEPNIDQETRDIGIDFYKNYNLLFPYYFYNHKGYNFIYTSLEFWDGIPDLLSDKNELNESSHWRAVIRESVFHENNYIFNKSAISLNWLYLHDQEFLTMLYEKYGYYGDDRLTQLYIDDVKNSFEFFLKYGFKFEFRYQPVGVYTDSSTLLANPYFFFGTYRPYDNKFLINKKLLEKFVTLTNGPEDYIYPFILENLVLNIDSEKAVRYYDSYFTDNNVSEEISKEFRLFIASHLIYYNHKIYEKNPDIAVTAPGLSHYGVLYTILYIEKHREELLSYLKKNNYLGYKDYPEIIETMRVDYGLW